MELESPSASDSESEEVNDNPKLFKHDGNENFFPVASTPKVGETENQEFVLREDIASKIIFLFHCNLYKNDLLLFFL